MAQSRSNNRNGNGRNGNGRRSQRRNRQRVPGQGQAATRNRADIVLAPGCGAITTCAFPKPRSARNGGGKNGGGYNPAYWDATLPAHLPLPRAVGPYTTIRTTKVFSSHDAVLVFGTFTTPSIMSLHTDEWSTHCCISSVNKALGVGTVGNANFHSMPLTALGEAATMVPSAMTVQVINPNPLQTTQGTVFGGTMNMQAVFGGETRSWESVAQTFVNFQSPRFMTAPKLSLRGVRVNSFPMNMSKVSEFMTLRHDIDVPGASWGKDVQPMGWAPIVVYNVGGIPAEVDPGPALTYIVTFEWRVRFDLTNPACAGHVHHPIVSDAKWDGLMKIRTAMGNGVEDIPDAIANVGEFVKGGVDFARKTMPYARAAARLAGLAGG